jgi:hypothetical protein
MTFSERMNAIMAKGIAASKEVLAKAGAQAQVWGEMGALKVEIIQLRKQAEKLVAQLGAEVFATFAERGQKSLSSDSPAVRDFIARIGDLEKAIGIKEKRYAELGGREDDLEKEEPREQ